MKSSATEKRAAAHTCHARGCPTIVKPELLMCREHWMTVPQGIQRVVWATYRPGQCDDMRPSKEWHEAADAAIGFVAAREGKPVRKIEAEALESLGYGGWLRQLQGKKKA